MNNELILEEDFVEFLDLYFGKYEISHVYEVLPKYTNIMALFNIFDMIKCSNFEIERINDEIKFEILNIMHQIFKFVKKENNKNIHQLELKSIIFNEYLNNNRFVDFKNKVIYCVLDYFNMLKEIENDMIYYCKVYNIICLIHMDYTPRFGIFSIFNGKLKITNYHDFMNKLENL